MASTPNGTVIDVITEEGEDGHPLPRVQKRKTGKNTKHPHPLEDFMVIKTEQVVHICMGDIIQIFWHPLTL